MNSDSQKLPLKIYIPRDKFYNKEAAWITLFDNFSGIESPN